VTDDHFRIYVEQLRDGHIEYLEEELNPEFIGIIDEDLKFVDPVHLEGEAYLADDDLVIKFNCNTLATFPCAICNEPTKHEVIVQGDYQMVPLEEIKGGVFDFKELLREAIILETPRTAECNEGTCPQRSRMKQYLKNKTAKPGGKDDDEGSYRPFADLDKLIK
jgi:uncharacterized metal-binding protein YceD (DUF177 family)